MCSFILRATTILLLEAIWKHGMVVTVMQVLRSLLWDGILMNYEEVVLHYALCCSLRSGWDSSQDLYVLTPNHRLEWLTSVFSCENAVGELGVFVSANEPTQTISNADWNWPKKEPQCSTTALIHSYTMHLHRTGTYSCFIIWHSLPCFKSVIRHLSPVLGIVPLHVLV